MGQRTNLGTSGTAFATAPAWAWGYDSLGQITGAASSVSTQSLAYQYDSIGNRIEVENGTTSLTGTPNYTANALNQYTAIGSLSPEYDNDGNATAYPVPAAPTANSTLAWDAGNRMVSAAVSGGASYLYDAFSRRIAKTTTSGGTSIFVYDGWNCIAEYTGTTPSLSKINLWGLDLSGSLQGAGGVGGLLSIHYGSNDYYPTYDGNGNVSEYLNSSGNVVSHFEYDPFGSTVVNTDTVGLFYRFSTKPQDAETGLYYYGYRYYDSVTGRWMSKDPIGEKGGVNLYGFVGNCGSSKIDRLGLVTYPFGVFPQESNCNSFAASGCKLSPAWNPTPYTLQVHGCRGMNDPMVGPPEPCKCDENQIFIFIPADPTMYHVVGTVVNADGSVTYAQQMGLGGKIVSGYTDPVTAAQDYYQGEYATAKMGRYCCKKSAN